MTKKMPQQTNSPGVRMIPAFKVSRHMLSLSLWLLLPLPGLGEIPKATVWAWLTNRWHNLEMQESNSPVTGTEKTEQTPLLLLPL